MKRAIWIAVPVIVLLMVSGDLWGDYLEVRRDTGIKAQPERQAQVIEKVKKGDYLPLLDEGRQKNGYYNVLPTSPGKTGWIYSSLVRRWHGEIHGPADDAAASPLRDTTLTLSPEQERFASRHLRLGKPQVVYERVREGYVLAQDGRLKIPLWVQYELRAEELKGPLERTNDFQPDTSIPLGFRAELADYSGSGYVRGQMAPAEDMARSRRAMAESFLMSNIAPQVGTGFSKQIWKNLEAAVRGWVEQRGRLTVIAGPIFAIGGEGVKYSLIGDNRVAVPTHFYKIVVDDNSMGNIETLAFIIPNENLDERHYSEFLVSIKEIEAATGLDFLSALPKDVQSKIESITAKDVW
jgi:endonuclease G